jgi:hypothetical protein
MENKLKFKKLKDLSVEQLNKRAKYFDITSWSFIILGIATYFIMSISALSLLNESPSELSLVSLAICLISSSGILFSCVFTLGCFICAVFLEMGRKQIKTELRIREVTAPLLERLDKLEKQIGRT